MTLHFAGFPYLSGIILSCLGALVVILLIPGRHGRLIKHVSLVAAALTLAICLYLFFAYDRAQGGLQFVERLPWVPALGIDWYNGADGFSLPMLLLTAIVLFTGVLTMWELEERVKEFFALTFLLVAGVFGMFMSLDLFFVFVWYDVSLFPMYPLIAIWGSTRKEYAAMKLTLYLLAGSALVLPAIIYLVTHAGMASFAITDLMRPGTFTPFQEKFAFLLLYLGFGILAGVWPFHTWSPVGHVAAPTSVSMIHAGVLMKLGAFGVLRVGMFLCPQGWQYWAELMALLAAIGIVYGVFVGLAQTDLKYVIGYSSVSHMGVVGLGLATVSVDGLNGAVMQMFAHGIMTALLFSAVGYIYDRTHTKMIPELGGLSAVMPVASGYFIVAALAGIGVPCLASFWAELLVFISAFRVYPVRGALAVGALVVSALFMLRVIQRTFYGRPPSHLVGLKDMSFVQGVPRAILAAVIIILGLYPALILDLIQSATVPFLQAVAP